MIIKKKLILVYERFYDLTRKWKLNLRYRFEVMSPESTVNYIHRTHCSIARFGDGEFGLINGSNNPSFQTANESLAKRLKEVCSAEKSQLLVCLPHSLKTTNDCNEFAKKFWEWWIWSDNNLEKAAKCLRLSPWKKRIFGDAQITRPYMDWKDKTKAGERFKQLKSLWENRDVVIIEGSQTKLGVGNDLLQNTKSIRRIICPANNAFDSYDEILRAAQEFEKEVLFLLALGPTATVLAFDLSQNGYQALDIGHIDIEYEWYCMGATSKVAIPGKYTQEAYAEVNDQEPDLEYDSQIIKRIE